MNYAELKTHDIANGPGVRVTLFVSGCSHHCKGCFNEVAWDYDYGQRFTDETINYIIGELRPDYIRGLTLLGGEPLDPKNQPSVLRLLQKLRHTLPKKDVWCYSGYVFETDILGGMHDSCPEIDQMLSLIDVLVDGPFIEAKKDISLRFKGSSNQRIIDVRESLKKGETILWED